MDRRWYIAIVAGMVMIAALVIVVTQVILPSPSPLPPHQGKIAKVQQATAITSDNIQRSWGKQAVWLGDSFQSTTPHIGKRHAKTIPPLSPIIYTKDGGVIIAQIASVTTLAQDHPAPAGKKYQQANGTAYIMPTPKVTSATTSLSNLGYLALRNGTWISINAINPTVLRQALLAVEPLS